MLRRSFAKDCRNITLNFRVEKVWRDSERWHVSNGRITKIYDKIVSTIPIQDLMDGLPDVPEPISRGVHGLRYNSLSVVMIGAASDSPPPLTALYVPDPALPFHRLSFSLSFTAEGAPPGHMAIAAEITTNPGDGIHELSDEEIIHRVTDGLEAMGFLGRQDVRFRRIHRTKHAYVVRTFDYQNRLTKASKYLRDLGLVSVGRNARVRVHQHRRSGTPRLGDRAFA